MRPPRVTLDAVPRDGACALSTAEDHYLRRVLRLTDGARVEAVDRDGTLWCGVLRVGAQGSELGSLDEVQTAADDATLAVVAALIKPSRWDWMLEKASELGATHIVPVVSERSVVSRAVIGDAGKRERWQRVCDAATRQSRRVSRVEVSMAATLEVALAAARELGADLVHFDETSTDSAWPTELGRTPTAIVVGPEGGFSRSERTLIAEFGASVVGLGSALLRAETASIAALSAIRLRRDGLL